VIAYRATLDVPQGTGAIRCQAAGGAPAARHPRGSRALSCFWQAVLGVRWFRDRTNAEALARKQPPGGRELDLNTRTRNAIQRSLRCLGERGFALLSGRWRMLQHITASPSKIGDIARAALVLTHFEHGCLR
jgi:DDE superfamily endonuclease